MIARHPPDEVILLLALEIWALGIYRQLLAQPHLFLSNVIFLRLRRLGYSPSTKTPKSTDSLQKLQETKNKSQSLIYVLGSNLLKDNVLQCVTNEEPPHNPCERCQRKGLVCEYVAVGDPSPPSTPLSDRSVSCFRVIPLYLLSELEPITGTR